MELRLPVNLLDGISETIYKHDAQFLAEVCKEFNIPFREAKIKILGVGKTYSLTVSSEAWNEGQQCEMWVCNPKTQHWKRCPCQQAVGFPSCINHIGYLSATSKLVKLASDLRGHTQLCWIKIGKEMFLRDPVNGSVWTCDDKPTNWQVGRFPNGKIYVKEKGSNPLGYVSRRMESNDA